MPNFGSYILYLLLLTIRYSAFGFTSDIRISTCYLTFTLLSLTSYIISIPSNHSPTCVWFYLRYKIRKIIQSSVLSFLGVFEGCEFPPSFSFSVFFSLLLLGRKPVVWIFSTNYAKFFCLFLWLCINVLRGIGECCESVPLDRAGSYILSA